MNEEYQELIKDIETDPIYDETKIKKANKIAFEKRMANLPPMKNKVAQIQRDSSLSILVAKGYYEEADKVLNAYEKMDSNWVEALKS
jgi:hypothetical protein